MKILFVTSNRIGDAILSTGLLDYLVHEYREAEVTVACGPLAAPLFKSVTNVVDVIPMVKQRWSLHWFDLWRQVAGRHWDVVVDLRASALAWTLRAGKRWVFGSGQSAGQGHRVIQLGRLLNLDPPPAPRVWLAPEDRARGKELIPADGRVLAVGPTANWGGKQWPIERFVEAVRRLTTPGGVMAGARVAVFGGPGEETMAAPLIADLAEFGVLDLVGKVELPEAAAALTQCDMFIGNDSGLMHLSAAVGLPTLGLFGPSRETHYAPWGMTAAVVRTDKSYDDLVGGPDYDYRSPQNHMGTLAVDRVVEAAEDLFRKVY